MLSIVRRALQELPMVPRDVELRYHINITTGDSLAISAFVGDDQFYQVKASEFVDLRGLYELHCRAWQDHPTLVPRPLGHHVDGGWSIMVTDGVHHKVLHRSAVLGSRWRRRGTMPSQLCMYFQRKERPGVGPDDEAQQTGLVRRVAAHFAGGPYARIASTCIRYAQAAGIEFMPMQAQHGDFVLNNLGQRDGRLVVFDWEDYGRVGLPGFDICTLCLSLLGEDVDALRRVMGARAQAKVLDEFLARACQAQGIELDRFRRLIPFYLLVFLYLKRNYGTAVQDRIGRLLTELVPRSEHSADSLVTEPAVSRH